jgi:TolB-like protein
MGYRLHLLGRFEMLSPSGDDIAVSSKKSQALIAILALARGEAVLRSRLCDLLWEDRGEDQARNSLRQAFASLRKMFKAQETFPFVVTEEDAAIDTRAFTLDTDQLFEASGWPALEHLHGGTFLEGLSIPGQTIQDWLLAERQRFDALRADRLAGCIADLESAEEHASALVAAQALLGIDPLNEIAHRAIMRSHARTGERAKALKQYQSCSDLLRRELDIEPDSETRRLYDDLKQQGSATVAAATEPSGPDVSGSDTPGLAVLPFDNLSGDPDQEYFSDGLTEDIITELSRFRELFVIARNSSFSYKGKAVKVQDVGSDLGVGYIVEGSVRRAGDRVRVTAQLVEAATGKHIWAEKFDRALTGIFELQDEITKAIVMVLPKRLQGAMVESVRRKPSENLSAYDCYMRGRWLFNQSSAQDPLALELFRKAVEIDPECAHAHAEIANTLAYSVFTFSPIGDDPLAAALDSLERALTLGEGDPAILSAAAEVYLICGKHDLAKSHSDKATAFNPNDTTTLLGRAFILTYMGDHQAGVDVVSEVFRYDPRSPDFYLEGLGEALYMKRDYEAAIEAYTRWQSPPVHMYTQLAASYAQLGQMEDAEAARGVFEARRPKDSDFAYYAAAHRRICKHVGDADHWIEGYRKAGLLG